jgi:hypothetical protein
MPCLLPPRVKNASFADGGPAAFGTLLRTAYPEKSKDTFPHSQPSLH